MPVLCSKCGAPIDQSDINVAKDVALCRACGSPLVFSELVNAVELGQATSTPPRGCWCRDEGAEMIVGATTRSWGAFFLVPFMCVWSGFSIGGIYGSQIIQRQFNPCMSVFGIPFVLGSVLFWSLALMMVCGKVEVRLRPDLARVFVGVGALGWRSSFDPTAFRSLRIVQSSARTSRGGPQYQILIEADSQLRFGALLSDARRDFLANVLTRTLRPAALPANA